MTLDPLRPLNRREIAKLERRSYFRGRWVYLRHVARLVRELAPRTVLEIGPGPHRFIPGSDTLDITAFDVEPTFQHDAGVTPWPLADGSHELVIGLQCWEHFDGRQAIAFREALRVAGRNGHVLISAPYRWTHTNAVHRGIGMRRIQKWTCGHEVLRRIHVRRPVGRQRMILLFRGGDR